MLNQPTTEFLIRTANGVALAEERYLTAMGKLEDEKAKLEEQGFSSSMVTLLTKDMRNEVNDLLCEWHYRQDILKINILQNIVEDKDALTVKEKKIISLLGV